MTKFLKLIFRHFRKYKLFSLISMIGLALGFACCMIIFIFVQNEFSYDKFHDQHENIYRITFEGKSSSGSTCFITTPPVLGPELSDEFPEITDFLRLRHSDDHILKTENRVYYEDNIFFADPSFFDILGFELTSGNEMTALDKPNTIVITKLMAEKYFGEEDPLGKIIRFDDALDLQVTGVINTDEVNSHIKFDFIISFSSFKVPPGYSETLESWFWLGFHTYIMINDNTNPNNIEQKMQKFYKENIPEALRERVSVFMQPISKVYLDSDGFKSDDSVSSSNIAYSYGLIAIAVLILIISCFNYINLRTVIMLKRSAEIGIRKIFGAGKYKLIFQMLSESIIISIIGFIFSLLFVEILTNSLSNVLPSDLRFDLFSNLKLFVIFLGTAFFIGVLTSIYPTFFILKRVSIKSKNWLVSIYRTRINLRIILIIFQFSLSILLITCTIIIMKQIHFLHTKNLGYDNEYVLRLKILDSEFSTKYPVLKNKFRHNANVISISAGGAMFDGQNGSMPVMHEKDGELFGYQCAINSVYHDFFDTFDIQFVEGRDFSESIYSDSSSAFILNQKAVEVLGLKNPINETIRLSEVREGKIIGVVKDYHFDSLHNEILPLISFIPFTQIGNIYIRLKPGNLPNALESIEAIWQEVAPNLPFDYVFIDDHIDKLYRQDNNIFKLIMIFSCLSVLITLSGLYAIVAFTNEQSTKEIGIRKIVGASAIDILKSLSNKYFIILFVSCLLSFPIAGYLMNLWLQDYAYKTSISLWEFLLSGAVITFLALITISFQTIRKVNSNIVDSLRYE